MRYAIESHLGMRPTHRKKKWGFKESQCLFATRTGPLTVATMLAGHAVVADGGTMATPALILFRRPYHFDLTHLGPPSIPFAICELFGLTEDERISAVGRTSIAQGPPHPGDLVYAEPGRVYDAKPWPSYICEKCGETGVHFAASCTAVGVAVTRKVGHAGIPRPGRVRHKLQ